MIEHLRETYQLKISLRGIKPPIWRRVLVSSTSALSELHEVFQGVMGWTDTHLHQFVKQNKRYGVPDPEFGLDKDLLDESKYRLKEVLKREGDSLLYEYDFGDGWEHTVKLEKILTFDLNKKLPLCLAGRRGCPPEDVGGVWGYKDFLGAYTDKNHPQHEEMVEWAGDYFHPEKFDLEEVNKILQQDEALSDSS